MKTFFQLKEELDTSLYEMEMITHKKKIAAAQAKFDAAAGEHAKAKKVHNDLAKKHGTAYIKTMKAKGHERKGLISNPPAEAHDNPDYKKYAAHSHYHSMHSAASEGDFNASHNLAKGAAGHFQHVSKKHDSHATKLHNNMVDAHHELQAAKKASPLHKAKSAIHKLAKKVGIREANVDEISDKKLGQYFDKAKAQHKKSKDYFDNSWPSRRKPDVAKKHDDRMKRRHKGIGSVIKRDMASPGQKYMTGIGRGERIQKGEKGATMTTKRADQLPKSYKKGTNK
jgi:hypothetical protein